MVLQPKDRKAAAIEVKTRADGNFRMNAVPPGSYSLAISHAGYQVFLIDVMAIKSGYETQIQSLKCEGARAKASAGPPGENLDALVRGFVY